MAPVFLDIFLDFLFTNKRKDSDLFALMEICEHTQELGSFCLYHLYTVPFFACLSSSLDNLS